MKLRSLFYGMLALATVVGCQETAPEPKLNVSRPSADVIADGGKVLVEVTANNPWTAEADAEWITAISPSSGEASDKPVSVEVTVAANENAQERTATVTFKSGALTETMTVRQEGTGEVAPPTDEPATGNNSDLFVAWAFSPDMKALNEKAWHQSENDLAEGFAEKYLAATIGTGKIQYYQPSKAGFETDKIRRHTGNSGEPMFYGSWEGDYYLFEAEYSLAANSNVGIAFGIWGKKSSMKYWMLEYFDENQWKSAAEVEELGDIRYNVVCGVKENLTVVNELVVFKAATDKVSFRLRCASKVSVEGKQLEAPALDQYVRIDPNYHFIIKGSEITEADIAGMVAPAVNLSESKFTLESSAEINKTVSLTSNLNWTAAPQADWISVLQTSGTASDSAVEVSVIISENATEQERTGVLQFEAKYGNVTIVEKLSVVQPGKVVEKPEPEPDPTPDPEPTNSLNVVWQWNANQGDARTEEENVFYNANNASWHQADTDKAAGDGGKYINPTAGTGKLSYVQLDKSSFGSEMRRHLGKNAEPVIYGPWKDDYILFAASDGTTYPAGTKVSVSFAIKGNNGAVKGWKLECRDGENWKTAIEEVNFTTSTQAVEYVLTTTEANAEYQFRLVCTGNVSIKGAEMTSPGGNIRIDPTNPLVIKVVK